MILQKQFEVFRMNLGGKYLLMAAGNVSSDMHRFEPFQSPTYLMVYSGYLCDLLKYTVRKL